MRDGYGRWHVPAGVPGGGRYGRESMMGDDADLGLPPLPVEPVPYPDLAVMVGRMPGVERAVVASGLDDRPMVVARRRRGADVYMQWLPDGNLMVDDDVLDMRMVPNVHVLGRVLAQRLAR